MRGSFVKLLDILEFIKIIFLSKLLGKSYLIQSLYLCREANIEKILNHYGVTIGINNKFKNMLTIDNFDGSFEKISIENNCYIGKSVFFDLANKIILHDDVVVSSGVSIITHADVGERLMKKYYQRVSKEVIIGKGSWIGANATILSGVEIGEFCVVAAGSVVTENVPDGCLVAGVPAVMKKKITE